MIRLALEALFLKRMTSCRHYSFVRKAWEQGCRDNNVDYSVQERMRLWCLLIQKTKENKSIHSPLNFQGKCIAREMTNLNLKRLQMFGPQNSC